MSATAPPRGASLAAGFGRLLLGLLLLQVLLTGFAVSHWLRGEESRLHRIELSDHARFLLPALEDSLGRWGGTAPELGRQAEIRHRMQRSLGDLRSLGLAWIDGAGNAAVVGFLQEQPQLPALLEAVRAGESVERIEAQAQLAGLPLVARRGAEGALLLAGQPGSGLFSPRSRGLLALLLAVSAATAGLAAWALARPLLKRFTRFHEAFRALGEGRLAHRLQDGHADELGQLAVEFNGMATRLEDLNARLEASDRRRRRLLSEVGHELGAPLTTLQGQLETLLRDGIAGESERRRVALALAQSRRLDRLVGDLLDLARLEEAGLRLERRPLRLGPLVEDEVAAVELACLEKGIELELELGTEPALVSGDAGRLAQILRNLLRNAIQQLDGYDADERRIRVALAPVASGLELRIEDNGPGIEARSLAQLFDRYYRPHPTQGSGSGLGLAISRRLAELHGGRLEAESDGPGAGARFRLWLPAIEAAAERDGDA